MPPRASSSPAAFTPSSLAFRLPPPGLAQIRRAHPLLIAAALAPGPEYGATVLLDAFALVRARAPTPASSSTARHARDRARRRRARPRPPAAPSITWASSARQRALAVVAAAESFVRPTLADGDAISVREALALGRRVVASAVGARPPEAALFPAGDAAAVRNEKLQCTARLFAENAPVAWRLPTLLHLSLAWAPNSAPWRPARRSQRTVTRRASAPEEIRRHCRTRQPSRLPIDARRCSA